MNKDQEINHETFKTWDRISKMSVEDILKLEEKNNHYKDIIEKLFKGIDEITAMNLYEDAYDKACELLDLESDLDE